MGRGKSTAEFHPLDNKEPDMAGISKTRRNKKVNNTTSVKATEVKLAATSPDHLYLRQQQLAAIEAWTQGIPKSLKPVQHTDDAIVQAYLEAKLALLQNGAAQDRKSSSATVSSTLS
ncbi:hypothetical protein BAUCODRAFT_124989 [Baudoinia panamericana UAMH 10762]|uniref:Uncharacterized protein n=1 Tax=Baudoinia panamericana (strain UAMH 10762) TaxID=717646 RepID=M2MRZ9_BAUPA|nr:uncharacterized protein BAUCODRAFT_124989 [Baudoinia panamericana UAMH 10762]EMC94278.1 hypothetical protein BAUCODRAFT_124989 [Baudoinia panamericana UAMH 10762]